MRKNQIVMALFAAAVLLIVAYSVKYFVSTGALEEITSKRVMGVVIGIYLAVVGNYMPKTLKPWAERQCNSTRWAALRRFSGWTFVLAGLCYSAIWAFAPIGQAAAVAKSIVAASLVLVAVPFIWLVVTSKRNRLAVED